MGQAHEQEGEGAVEAARAPDGPRAAAEWRLVGLGADESPRAETGAANMGLDAALLEAVRGGAPPVLRLYRWDPATLSFGRNQPAAGLYDEAAAAERGIAFVRRPTGGQAVLHDDELTYAVIAGVGVIGKPRAAYRLINGALVAGLRRLGLAASLAGAPRPGGAGAEGHDWLSACFRTPAQGEVVSRGRKLIGSAQRTEGRTILQHGSILVGGSQAAAEELLLSGQRGSIAWTTVSAELGRRPTWGELAAAVVGGFEEALGIGLAPAALTVQEQRRARDLDARFGSREWTWRR